MNRLNILSVLTSLLAINTQAQEAERPNILFLLIDDLGWSDLSCYGSQYHSTPTIDKLASDGIRFTDAYAMPTSSPSRAALMSGKHSTQTGVYTVDAYAHTPDTMRKLLPPKLAHFLEEDEYTMAEMLKEAGYTNGHFGKWHLGNRTETYPLGQGFDENVAGCEAGAPNSYFAPFKNLKNIDKQPNGTYITDVLLNNALQFIDKNKANPFFLYFSFYEVHVPLHVKKEYLNRFEGKAGDDGQNVPEYAAMLSYVDDCVEALLLKLKRLGLEENTLIILTSDNGGQIMVTDNAPLRGQKGNLYEGGIRVPLIMKWPNQVEAGMVEDTPVSVLDYYPTLADLVGAESVPQALDGESLGALITKQKPLQRNALFWHMPSYNGDGDKNSKLWQPPVGVIRKGAWKLIEYFEDDSLELYNLTTDISETTNLVYTNSAKAAELLQELKAWQKSQKAPFPIVLNPQYSAQKRAQFTMPNIRIPAQAVRLKRVQ